MINDNNNAERTSKPKIVVVGSANTDLVVQVSQFPQRGETILGHHFFQAQGGKGANQAVAAARLGADVTLVARIGQDTYGQETMAALQAEGIDITHMVWDDNAVSGIAMIMVEDSGENIIAVTPGANSGLCPADVQNAEAAIAQADYLLMQLEIPVATVQAAIDIARRHHVPIILNPAPANNLSLDLLSQVDILTPNESETATLVGNYSAGFAKNAAYLLPSKGIKKAIVTLGSRGALIVTSRKRTHVNSFPTTSIDTTGAGDAFNGALAVALANGDELVEAVRFANAVGSLAVSKAGAQDSLPTLAQVEQFLSIQAHKNSSEKEVVTS